MRIKTTYQHLNAILHELNAFHQMDFPTVKKFAENRLKTFYRQNNTAISYLNQKTLSLLDAHVEETDIEERAMNGMFKFQKQVVDTDDGPPQEIMMPVFKDNEHAALYNQAWDNLMNKECYIIL